MFQIFKLSFMVFCVCLLCACTKDPDDKPKDKPTPADKPTPETAGKGAGKETEAEKQKALAEAKAQEAPLKALAQKADQTGSATIPTLSVCDRTGVASETSHSAGKQKKQTAPK